MYRHNIIFIKNVLQNEQFLLKNIIIYLNCAQFINVSFVLCIYMYHLQFT